MRRCIDSILAQTYPNFELILVDDGSKDSSATIIDEYAAKDSRIIPIHQPNGGVSSARNAGLDNAYGDYVVFIDADDYITPPYLHEYQRNSEDLIIGGYKSIGHICDKYKPSENKVYRHIDKTGLLQAHFEQLYFRTPWAKAFRREIIEINALYFRLGMRFGEDTEFVLRYINACRDISTNMTYSYVYNSQSDGLSKYSLTAQEYLNCSRLIENAILSIASGYQLNSCIVFIRKILKCTFEVGMWHSGLSFAKRNSVDWLKLKLWQHLPTQNIYIKTKESIKIFLWPLIYRKLIQHNSRI